MAQLPVYRQQGNITTDTPGQIRDLNTYAQGSIGLQRGGNALYELAAKWQESKDAVENLNGRNKLSAGLSEIINEARNYNDYSTPEELQQKEQELTDRMNNLVPEIVSGFSNNQRAREFESNGQFVTQQNTFKLQDIFRQKYGDMYNATLQDIADRSLKSYTMTGDEAYKQEYFDALDTGMKAGYISREQAEKLKLGTDDWNYSYVYSQILENPYFKISDDIMAKIDPVKQRTLRNFQRTEQKRANAEALQAATNDYYLNPTQTNLNRLYKLNPKLRGSKQLESAMNRQPNYEAITTIESMGEALGEVKELAAMDVSTPDGKKAYAQKAAQIGLTLNKLQKDGTISEKDYRNLYNMIYKDMMDDNFKSKLNNMPDLSKEWYSEHYKNHAKLQTEFINASQELNRLKNMPNMQGSDALKKAEARYQQAFKAKKYYNNLAVGGVNSLRIQNAPEGVNQKIKNLERQATENMLKAYMAGDIKLANQIKEQFGNDMVRAKYWNIPALQRQNLKVGDKFTVNGKVYSYQGFSKNDVIVEVH